MCFSATANFVGSTALGAIGVVTLTMVKHRRELLFATLPTLFAIHQFIEGFVWLGLDGKLPRTVTHDMGAAFMLYAQGLLPFLLPLSVLAFEPTINRRRPMQVLVEGNSIVYVNPATNNAAVAVVYLIATFGSLFFSQMPEMILFGAANLVILVV